MLKEFTKKPDRNRQELTVWTGFRKAECSFPFYFSGGGGMYCPNSRHGRPEMAKAGREVDWHWHWWYWAYACPRVAWLDAGWLAGLLSDSQLALLCYTTAAVLTDM